MKLSELGFPSDAGAFAALAFAWGALWGSFLNVVIYRMPLDMSVVHPGSHCPGCAAPVRPLDNIPILSWLLLRGRARCCGVRISPRYVVIEALGGLLAVVIFEAVIRPMPDPTLLHAGFVFLADFGLAMALVAAAFIDAEHMYLPDPITLGGTVCGLATAGFRGLPWAESFLGAAVGFGGVWLPFVVGYRALRGKAGMGLGDVKLTMLAGAWFGWPAVAFALFAGAFQSLVAAVVLLLRHGKIEEPESVRKDREELEEAAAGGDEEARKILEDDPLARAPEEGILSARMPFGPFLCLGIVEWMLAGPYLAERAWAFLAP
jgi:leader peptidase (prepilin peptidase)/N-methyltransferase